MIIFDIRGNLANGIGLQIGYLHRLVPTGNTKYVITRSKSLNTCSNLLDNPDAFMTKLKGMLLSHRSYPGNAMFDQSKG
jgi:hypothetical protein